MRPRYGPLVLTTAIGFVALAEACATSLPALLGDGLPPWQFATTTATAVDLDAGALYALVERAESSRSDTLLVLQDGRVIVERYFDEASGGPAAPIEAKSVTKSVVALAIGVLLDEGRIRSLDAPMSTWFSEWSDGDKAKVTLRHVLTHTSGLEHRAGDGEMSRHDDRLAYVRALPIVVEPGTEFSYNNEATQLLAGVVRSAAGKPLDDFVGERLLAPLGIDTWSWDRDPSGTPLAYTGLRITARGLAIIGQMVLDGGRFDGKSIVDGGFIDRALRPNQALNPGYGLLWWLRPSPDGAQVLDANANGWLGQYLVVCPRSGRVAVRQRRGRTTGVGQVAENELYGFGAFPRLVGELAPLP